MNLWAKSLERLAMLAVALFFFSCEDETSLIGLKNPNSKFHVGFIEIPLTSSVLSVDSVYTDNKAVLGGLLVGEYTDASVGKLRAESYVQILPPQAAVLSANAIFDSVTVQLRLNYYSYGFAGEHDEKISFHEITGEPIGLVASTTRYDAKSSIAHDPLSMGEGTVRLNYETFKKQLALAAGSQDTLLVQAKLSTEFGLKIFDQALKNTFTSTNTDATARQAEINAQYDDFFQKVKGFVIKPAQSSGIFGLRFGESFSRITLHYRDNVGSTLTNLTRTYGIRGTSFSQIQSDRSATELAALGQSYQNIEPNSGMRYVQSGAPIVTKLDLAPFYVFADSTKDVIVNEAQLIIEGVSSPPGAEVHSSMLLKPMRADNQFYNAAVAADSVVAPPKYYVVSAYRNAASALDVHYKHYLVNSDLPTSTATAARLVYSESDANYSAYLTLFVQTLLLNKGKDGVINPNRLMHVGLVPSLPSGSYAVNRTIFPGDKIKLRVYYTRATAKSTD
jgi:hypothetical protein